MQNLSWLGRSSFALVCFLLVTAHAGRLGQHMGYNLGWLELSAALSSGNRTERLWWVEQVLARPSALGRQPDQAVFMQVYAALAQNDVPRSIQLLQLHTLPGTERGQTALQAIAQWFLEHGDVEHWAETLRQAGMWYQPQTAQWALAAATDAASHGRAEQARMLWGFALDLLEALQSGGGWEQASLAHSVLDAAEDASQYGYPEQADALYRIALQMEPRDTDFHRRLASVLMDRYDDPAGAIKQYEEIVRLDPRALTFQQTLQLATLLRQVERYGEARKWAMQASTMDPGSLQPRLEIAIIAMLERKNQEAMQIALEILSTNGDNAQAYTVLGWAYGAQGRFEEAVAAERKAISLRSDADWPYALLASYLAAQQDYASAEIAIGQAIALSPREVSYVVQLAGLLALQNRRAEALSLYRQVQQQKGVKPYEAQIQAQIEELSQ